MTTKGAGANGWRIAMEIVEPMQLEDFFGAVENERKCVRDRSLIFPQHFAGHGRAAVRDVADTIAGGQANHPSVRCLTAYLSFDG